MSLMQACQDSEGAHGETKDILQDDNKENIPVFIAEDIVNENTTTIALSQVVHQTVIPVEKKEENYESLDDKQALDVSATNNASLLPSPVVTDDMITSNGNSGETTDKNTFSDDAENEALIDSIIANAVAAVNGEVGSAFTSGSDCLSSPSEGFEVLEAAPDSHKFKLTMFQPTDPPHFYRTVRKEMKLLKTSLPLGIWVRGYEDRMDLYSVMIRGPERTPYEDGLFFFDFQLSADYPRAPPLCHYVTYCSDKLNPNLYEDGKVCVSLLGTWNGKGTEVWTSQSNLLQVIISIQGLILVSEPYFNEAGYERQKGTQQGRENSRMYNEMVVLKLIQAMAKVIQAPPDIFKKEIIQHFHKRAFKLVQRLECWLEISENHNASHPLSPTTPTTFREIYPSDAGVELPEFPLIPASKGFCITLRKTLKQFKSILESVGVSTDQKLQARELDSNLPKTAVSSSSVETKVAKATYVETEKEKVVGGNS